MRQRPGLKVTVISRPGLNNQTYDLVSSQGVELLYDSYKSRKENPQKPTQLSSRSHPRHLVGKRTAQKTIIDITSDSQVNSNFPNRWSQASLTFNNYFYLYEQFSMHQRPDGKTKRIKSRKAKWAAGIGFDV